MAKSDCGLPAHSHATKCQIGKEELELNQKLAYGAITFKEYEKRYKQLLKEGKIVRSGRKIDEVQSG